MGESANNDRKHLKALLTNGSSLTITPILQNWAKLGENWARTLGVKNDYFCYLPPIKISLKT